MRKSEFVDEVYELMEHVPPNGLKELLLEFAHNIPSYKYDDMLRLFKKPTYAKTLSVDKDLLASVRELCESAKRGDYNLSYDYDGYDGEYWSDGDTLIDHDNLGVEIEELLYSAIHSVQEKRYEEALKAFDELHSISIPSDDYEIIGLPSLFENRIVSMNEDKVQRNYAYAALMVLRNDERISKLFSIIKSYTNLRDIIEVGTDEIPDKDEFFKQWIEFLMGKETRAYEMAIINAVRLSGGTSYLRDFVIDHGKRYQTSYLELMKDYVEEKHYGQAIDIAERGLEKLNPINSSRTKIADFLLEIGHTLNDNQIIKAAVWEGFRSSVDLRHFVAIYQSKDGRLYDQAIKYVEGHKNSGDYLTMCFLNGDYELVWKSLKKDKRALGWSASEKGKILPLFIALLAGDKPIKPCTYKMIKTYYAYEKQFDEFMQVLGECLNKISEADYQNYQSWCQTEISGRVEAIVKGQHRGSYHKASALVVSIAEAIKSKSGESNAASFIMGYKAKYPRHSAFHACLREDIKLARFSKLF